MRLKVSDHYDDPTGTVYPRGSQMDGMTLHQRVFGRIKRAIGEHEEANRTVLTGANAYSQGDYEIAYWSFEKAVELCAGLAAELAPQMEICQAATTSSKDRADLLYEQMLQRWRSIPRLRARLVNFLAPGLIPYLVRCKHCGHYTLYTSSYLALNVPPEYEGTWCQRCGRDYLMPDFVLDSLDGQAHVYYLGSAFPSGRFYRDFEQRFDVDPVMRFVDNLWVRVQQTKRQA